MKTYKSLLAILAVLFCGQAFAQTEFQAADSLFNHWVKEDRSIALQHLNDQGKLAESQATRVKYLINKSYWFTTGGQQDSALYFSQKAESLCKEAEVLGRIFVSRSSIFLKMDRSDSSFFYLKKATNILPESAQLERFSANYNLASSYQRRGKFDSAYKYIHVGFDMAQKGKPELKVKQMAFCNQLMGMQFFRTSVYDSALTYLLLAVDGFHEIGNSYGESHSMDAIGGVLVFQEKYSAALPYYRKAIMIAKKDGARADEAEFLHNLGTVFKNWGKGDSAKIYYVEALGLAQENSQLRLEANCSGNLGGILLEEGNPRAALSYLERSEAIFKQIKSPVGACLSRIGLGQCQQALGNPKVALEYLRDALRIGNQLPILEIQKECKVALYDYYQALPNADSALHYYIAFTEIKDSIQGTEVKTQIERLQVEYETKLHKEENLRLSVELDFEQERNRIFINRMLYLVGFGLLLLISLSTIYYFRNKNKKLRILLLKQELKVKEGQRNLIKTKLDTAQETIVQKNQLLTKLESDLKSGTTLQQLADNLHERISTQGDWMQFMIEFELVHAGFFDELKRVDPNLSTNDLRFSALLRLQLSNKEIAEVLLITLDGVKKAKNRLKKKLGLPAEEKLGVFISQVKTMSKLG